MRGAQNPGGVHHRVQAAQGVDRGTHAIDDRLLVGDVHLQRGQALTAAGFGGLGAGLVQSVGGDVGGHDRGAFVQQT